MYVILFVLYRSIWGMVGAYGENDVEDIISVLKIQYISCL